MSISCDFYVCNTDPRGLGSLFIHEDTFLAVVLYIIQ